MRITALKNFSSRFWRRHRSLAMAYILVIGILSISQMMKSKNDGTAMASPSHYVNIVAAAQEDLKGQNIRQLRQSIAAEPQRFLKLSGGEVMAMLEKPELVRVDLPTVTWQYRSESCVLDLYFTAMDSKLEKAQVSHYEVRERLVQRLAKKNPDDVKSQAECMEEIVQAPSLKTLVNLR